MHIWRQIVGPHLHQTVTTLSNHEAEKSLSVCLDVVHVSWEPFIQSVSHFVDLLLRIQGDAALNWVELSDGTCCNVYMLKKKKQQHIMCSIWGLISCTQSYREADLNKMEISMQQLAIHSALHWEKLFFFFLIHVQELEGRFQVCQQKKASWHQPPGLKSWPLLGSIVNCSRMPLSLFVVVLLRKMDVIIQVFDVIRAAMMSL